MAGNPPTPIVKQICGEGDGHSKLYTGNVQHLDLGMENELGANAAPIEWTPCALPYWLSSAVQLLPHSKLVYFVL